MAFWDGQRWMRPTDTTPKPTPHRLRDFLATIPIVALPIVLGIAVLTRAAAPTLSAPARVAPGATVTVSGTSFPRNLRIQLAWDGATTSMPSARTDRSGAFSTSLKVPAVAAVGSHTITALAMKGPRNATATVLASVSVTVATPGSASPSASASSSATASPSPRVTPTPTATARPTATPTPRPTATPTSPPPAAGTIRHVIVVWLENHEYDSVTASSMPYYYGLLHTYGQATGYYAVSHPSLPNYLALWSGSTQGVTDDGTHNLSAVSLSNQATNAGLTWRAYMQDYPTSGCDTGSSASGGIDGPGVAGTYVRKHNPPMSFTYVSGSASQCANIQPLARFDPSVNIAFVSPNLCNDAHDCSLTTADTFLRGFLPEVFSAPDWAHTALFVTFDEGSTSTNGGGHVTMLVARAGLSGFSSSAFHNHYGLLRTIQDTFGLGCLASSCSAAPLSEFMP